MKKILLFLQLVLPICLMAQYEADFYVAVDGDDSNPGTFEAPWGTWQKAFETAQAGDTIYFRGGTWSPTNVVPSTNVAVLHSPETAPVTGHNGTATEKICFFNYPGEVPVLDCSQLDTVGRNFNGGITLTGSHFIHFRGLTVTNVYQPHSGELASGIGANGCSNLTFENMTVSNIGGRGMTYWGIAGHPEAAEILYDTTYYINCDVYNCIDSLSEVPGNGSDGWKLDNESAGYLYFYGCRSWNCGDDGFDISGPGLTVFDHCWSFEHNFPGAIDGNGFKFGANRGDDAYIDSLGNLVLGAPVEGPRKIVKNCISAFNLGSGFYDLGYTPYYPNNSRIFNNVSYRNGIGMYIVTNDDFSGVHPSIYRNNIIYEPEEVDAAGRPYYLVVGDIYIESHNTWDYADSSIIGSLMWWQPTDTVLVTDDDFISLDGAQLSNPRKSDGSLPDVTFMKLAEGSDLIDAGTDVGIPFYGTAPDIGWAEYEPVTAIDHPLNEEKNTFHCYPNPAHDRLTIVSESALIHPTTMKMIDNTGTVVFSRQIQPYNALNLSIDLKPYATGVYYLVLNDGSNISYVKVLKI